MGLRTVGYVGPYIHCDTGDTEKIGIILRLCKLTLALLKLNLPVWEKGLALKSCIMW